MDPKISKKCGRYYKIPNLDKKRETCSQNPTAGP